MTDQDQLTDHLLPVTQVSATMETDHIEIPVPKLSSFETLISTPTDVEERELSETLPEEKVQEMEIQRNLEKESQQRLEYAAEMDDKWERSYGERFDLKIEAVPEIFSKNEELKEKETNILKDNNKERNREMEEDRIAITPNVFTTSSIKYLIRIDKEEFAFADDEKTALLIINSLAISEVKRLSGPGVKVFRQDLQDGKEVKICTQSLGLLVNGRVIRSTIIDVIPVPKVWFELQKE